jgi:hypothetical protein
MTDQCFFCPKPAARNLAMVHGLQISQVPACEECYTKKMLERREKAQEVKKSQ